MILSDGELVSQNPCSSGADSLNDVSKKDNVMKKKNLQKLQKFLCLKIAILKKKKSKRSGISLKTK